MEMIEISPVKLIWSGMLILWFGFCSAYFNKEDTKIVIKGLGVLLLITGIFLLGIAVGGR